MNDPEHKFTTILNKAIESFLFKTRFNMLTIMHEDLRHQNTRQCLHVRELLKNEINYDNITKYCEAVGRDDQNELKKMVDIPPIFLYNKNILNTINNTRYFDPVDDVIKNMNNIKDNHVTQCRELVHMMGRANLCDKEKEMKKCEELRST